jgi:hypothetical protein
MGFGLWGGRGGLPEGADPGQGTLDVHVLVALRKPRFVRHPWVCWIGERGGLIGGGRRWLEGLLINRLSYVSVISCGYILDLGQTLVCRNNIEVDTHFISF